MYRSMETFDLNRVKIESARIRNENEILRCRLRNLKANPYQEYQTLLENLILHSTSLTSKQNKCSKCRLNLDILCRELASGCTSCGCTECEIPEPPQPCAPASNSTNNCMSPCPKNFCPTSKPGAGCAAMGSCGGYTPSGWNKAGVREIMEIPGCGYTPRKAKSPCPTPKCEEEPPCAGQDARTAGVVDCKDCPSVRILGELAFQLERRILEYVFGEECRNKRRFYGYTVSNICYTMAKESTTPAGKTDAISKCDKVRRFQEIMNMLQLCGYDIKKHPAFTQDIINRYGVFACPPDQFTIQEYRLQDPAVVARLINKLSGSPWEIACMNILLRCLSHLSRCDGKPIFVW